MAQGTFTCSADTEIVEIAELMKANDVGALVIVDSDQKPIGGLLQIATLLCALLGRATTLWLRQSRL